MSLLANHFAEKSHTEVHLVLIGIKREISYPLDESVIVHRPGFEFSNRRRTFDTLRTMAFIRSEVKTIDPDTILSFGEMWNNMVLLSLWGLTYPVYISDRSEPNKDLGKLHNALRNKLYPSAAGYIAQTEKAGQICLDKQWNTNVKVIGNPIRTIKKDPTVFKENIVLTVGRLIKTKHIDQLIDIFADIDHPDWKLIIVGGDAKKLNLSEELQNKIDEKQKNGKIRLEGQQKNVDNYYNKSKLFAFTSSSEGFPNVIGEALSAGLPVVSYDCVAGPADMIDDGENGYLVELFDKTQFRNKLKKLMDNRALRKSLGQNAQKISQKFNSNEITDSFFSFIVSEKLTG